MKVKEFVATVYRTAGKIIVRINGTNYTFTANGMGGLTVTMSNLKVDRTWTPIYSQVVNSDLQTTAQRVMEQAAKKLGKGWKQGY